MCEMIEVEVVFVVSEWVFKSSVTQISELNGIAHFQSLHQQP